MKILYSLLFIELISGCSKNLNPSLKECEKHVISDVSGWYIPKECYHYYQPAPYPFKKIYKK